MMKMTDDRLLEAAARAVSLPWDQWVIDGDNRWNSLVSGDDALYLACTLGMEFSCDDVATHMAFAHARVVGTCDNFISEPVVDDPCKALRRAITRAAAEQGHVVDPTGPNPAGNVAGENQAVGGAGRNLYYEGQFDAEEPDDAKQRIALVQERDRLRSKVKTLSLVNKTLSLHLTRTESELAERNADAAQPDAAVAIIRSLVETAISQLAYACESKSPDLEDWLDDAEGAIQNLRAALHTDREALPPSPSDEDILLMATRLFPRWQEDIQDKFVLQLVRATLAAATAPRITAAKTVGSDAPDNP